MCNDVSFKYLFVHVVRGWGGGVNCFDEVVHGCGYSHISVNVTVF